MDDEAFDEAAFDAWLAGDPGRRRAFETMWQRIMGSDMDAALRTYKRRGAARAWLAGGAAALVVLAGGYKIVPLVELNRKERYDRKLGKSPKAINRKKIKKKR